MPRSAWGLSTPSDLPWQARARCAQPDVDPDWWSADGQFSQARAVHECVRHCPVRTECEANVAEDPLNVAGTIRAGVLYVGGRSDPRPAAHQPPESSCGWCAWPPVNGVRTFAVAGVR